MIGIYKITSPSKKIYIGQSVNIKKRFKTYKNLYCINQTKLYNSLKKYGFEKHKFEILQECEKEQLNELEVYYVELYQSLDSKYGLNIRAGGGSICTVSDETKIRLASIWKGKKHSEQTRKKMSDNNKGSNNPHFGKKHSDETKKLLSELKKGKKIKKEKIIS